MCSCITLLTTATAWTPAKLKEGIPIGTSSPGAADASAALNGYLKLTDAVAHQAVHQFSHGI